MRNLLALVGAALVAFLGLGWYLDWYHITPKPATATGHRPMAGAGPAATATGNILPER